MSVTALSMERRIPELSLKEDVEMGFVNEYISAEDLEKYRIKDIDNTRFPGQTNARDWTIDRERGMYLRNVSIGREDWSHVTQWTFLWHEYLFLIEIQYRESKGKREGPRWTRMSVTSMRLLDISQPPPRRIKPLPPQLKAKRDEILADLKEALLAHKDAGVFSTCTDYSLTLDIELK